MTDVDYDMNIMSTEKSYAFQNSFLSPFFFIICMREYTVLQSGRDTHVINTIVLVRYFLSSVTLAFGGKFLAHVS